MREPISESLDRFAIFALDHLEGFRGEEACRALEWDARKFGRIVRQFRETHCDETLNLVCDPGSHREPWVYRLVGNYEDAQPWATNRLGDLEARLMTIEWVAQTVTNVTQEASRDGRRARLIHSTVHYLRTVLENMNG